MEQQFLRVTAARTNDGLPVVLLLGRNLPSVADASAALASIPSQLSTLPAGPFALIYLHANVPTTTFWGVRAFRRLYESVPLELRQRIARLAALHVSFPTRAHVYANSSWLECGEYGKLEYCDLICDLEKALGIDALLAGLDDEDVRYDSIMRTWVARDDEIKPAPSPNPKAPSFSWDSIDFSFSEARPEATARPTYADGV